MLQLMFEGRSHPQCHFIMKDYNIVLLLFLEEQNMAQVLKQQKKYS